MKTLLHTFLDLTVPQTCVYCHTNFTLGASVLCTACASSLSASYFYAGHAAYCKTCGNKNLNANKDITSQCEECNGREVFFGNSLFLLNYDHLASSLMRHGKFKSPVMVINMLQNFLPEGLGRLSNILGIEYSPENTLIIALPSGKKLAGLFARAVAKRFHIPVYSPFMFKSSRKKDSKGSNRYQRFEQLQESLVLNKEILPVQKDSRVLLLDDIYTTGATVNTAARQIVENCGIEKDQITVFCIARRQRTQFDNSQIEQSV